MRAMLIGFGIVVVAVVLIVAGFRAYLIRSWRMRDSLGYDNDPTNDPDVGRIRGLRASAVYIDEVQHVGGRDRIMIPATMLTPEPDLGALPDEIDPEEADRIRAQVDRMEPRYHPDGTVNARHVAIEQTLRQRIGLPAQIMRLDGMSFRRPTDPPR